MQRQKLSVCCLVVLLLASAVAATAPAAATTTAQPSSTSASDAVSADDRPDRIFNNTAFLAMDDAGDGDVVAGGQTGLANPNATLMRIDEDGETEWTTRFESDNATQVIDLVATADGDVYFLLSERPRERDAGQRAGDLQIVRATADGDVTWRESLNTSVVTTRGASLVESDDGAAVAYRDTGERGVRLAEYARGDAIWDRVYPVAAAPSSLRKTDDGYLLAGTVNFDDPWVLRTSESGREQLNVTLAGLEADRVVDAVTTDDGGTVVVGEQRAAFTADGQMAWAARVDGDGLTRWNRVYDGGDGVQVRDVFESDDGLVLVGQNRAGVGGSGSTTVLGIGYDGAERFHERLDTAVAFTAVTRADDSLRAAGVTEFSRAGYTSALRSVPIPEADAAADAGLDADVGATSNETVYRGQNVRIEDTSAAGDSYDLVRLPGERDEFEPQVVRRVTLDRSGTTVFESAMLPDGEYVLQTPDGAAVALDDGQVTGVASREEAQFSVRSQRFFRVETNRTFVDVADGERGVSLSLRSSREDYAVHVSARRSDGEAVDADALRSAFGDAAGFDGVENVNGRPVARIEMGSRDRVNASVDGFGPGLYEVTVSGVDTRDGGAIATGRVVVGNDSERRLGLVLENESFTLAAGEETATNVTLTNVSNGVSAMSMSANRTGEPAFRLDVDLNINASRASASAGLSQREATAAATGFDGDTPNGTVTVGSLGVHAESIGRDDISNGTNTVTFRIDWVVDEDGIPYALPDETTITVEVTDADAAGGDGSGDEADSDGETEGESDGESEGESDDSSGSGSGSDAGSDGTDE